MKKDKLIRFSSYVLIILVYLLAATENESYIFSLTGFTFILNLFILGKFGGCPRFKHSYHIFNIFLVVLLLLKIVCIITNNFLILQTSKYLNLLFYFFILILFFLLFKREDKCITKSHNPES